MRVAAAAIVVFLALHQQLMRGASAQGGTCFDTLASRIKSDDNLIYFSSALGETSLESSLQGPGPYLVFAPDDAAFSNLRGSKAEDVLNLDLSKLVQYHIAGASAYERYLAMTPGSTIDIRTLCSDCNEVTIETLPSGKVLVNEGANAYEAVETCNGLLVIINDVLSPSIGSSVSNPSDKEEDIECSVDDPTCCDLPPPEFTCALQKQYGKCDEPWMLVGNGNGGFCRYTCGRCGRSPSSGGNDDTYDFGGYEDDYEGDTDDACRCTEDGYSGAVDTGQVGCFKLNAEVIVSMATDSGRRIGESLSQYFGKDSYEYSKFFGKYWAKEAGDWAKSNMGRSTKRICYVSDPANCGSASSSSEFIGAGWRSCD